MPRFVIDCNVAVVANGQPQASISCRIASIEFLMEVISSHIVLLDLGGDALKEYRKHLSPKGQPGVGDRFYQTMLMSHPDRVERVDIPLSEDGEYLDVPESVIEAGFDPSDRKWVALALKGDATVAVSVDSDWVEHRPTLEAAGVPIRFVCGTDRAQWFIEGA